MTSKREKLQYAYVFFADLLTMAVSVLLAWLITDGLFGVLIPYTSTDWLQTLCLLFVAFVVTFFFFDQDKNIVTRSENEEISLSLRFNIAFGLVYAGCMLLAKATMLDSRYFAVTVPAVNAVLLPFSHAILKRLLIRFQRSWGMETLVGVVTTSDRAERLIPEIQKDWSRRVARRDLHQSLRRRGQGDVRRLHGLDPARGARRGLCRCADGQRRELHPLSG